MSKDTLYVVTLIVVYLGGAYIVSLIFPYNEARLAYYASPQASWWGELSMFAWLAWGIGGLAIAGGIAHKVSTDAIRSEVTAQAAPPAVVTPERLPATRPDQAMNAYRGPPMTLGNAAAAHMRLIVWCLDCHRRVEPDPAEMAERYGAEMAVPEWRQRLVCGGCGSRRVDMVVTGTDRRSKSPAHR